MKPILASLAVLALSSAGCAAAPVRTFIGQPDSGCSPRGEVRGAHGWPVGSNGPGEARQVVAEAQRLGADALRFRSAVDELYRAQAFACGDAKVHAVNVVAAKFLKEQPPGSCQEVGVVEATLARTQTELREILTTSAVRMGGNVMRLDATGTRRFVDEDRVTGVGTAYWCPDLW